MPLSCLRMLPHQLLFWSFLMLMLWAGGAALVVHGAKTAPLPLVVKNPVGFAPPA
jgi:hypothetical protein